MNMQVRKKRIKGWIIMVMIAFALLSCDYLFGKDFGKPKENLVICAPNDMEKAFKFALKRAGMKSKYNIVITDNPKNANIVVDYAKDADSSYEKLAFSPFIVAYDDEKSYLKKLEDSKLVKKSAYEDTIYEIDLLSLVNATIDGKKLDEYGIEGFENVKVVYPDESTIYWHDFYNLMLVTANNGKYPKTSEEYEAAVSLLNQFFESENTEAVTDFDDKITRSGGLSPDIFYIVPEKFFWGKTHYVRFFFPKETVYFNYYLKADELGKKLVSAFGEKDWNNEGFYRKLYYECYRTQKIVALDGISSSYISGYGDVYNVVKIPEKINFIIEAKE